MGKNTMILLLLGVIYLKICLVASQNDESSLLALQANINSDILSRNWSPQTLFCTWIGVNCSRGDSRVRGLDLSSMGLNGTIPAIIGKLSFLTVLNMTNNSIHGVIPPEIGNLRQLRSLDLSMNRLTDHIPESLGWLRNLESLSLSYNQLKGDIPTSLSACVELQIFDLSHNNLTGNIPVGFGNFSQLQKFILWKNELTGELPSTIFNISSVLTIDVSENQMFGKLPQDICSHPASKLEELWLYSNQFDGPILPNLNRCRSIKILSVSRNNFTGNIPPGFSNLTTIQNVGLGRNAFSGTIPSSIGNLPNLGVFDIAENNFHGTIPSEIGNLPNLTWFNVKSNSLTGEVPQSIFNLSTLIVLTLSMNNFSGSLPTSIGTMLPNIRDFILTGNRFNGTIPSSISNLSKLEILDLSNNSFTGQIPITIGKMSSLQRLTLSNNFFANNVSKPEQDFLSSLSNSKSLTTINIDSNPISGVLPKSIGLGNMTLSLEQFTAHSCGFVGRLPDEIGNLTKLVSLNLGYNDLTGSVPTVLGSLKNMQKLDLYGNNLQGALEVLCNLEKLFSVDLRENRYVGRIPGCLGSLSMLTEINLAFNEFNSSIPSSLWSKEWIQKMNLSNNFLDGSLPLEFGSTKTLRELDLSGNQISGEIPSTISELQSLIHLSLSDNKMDGPIDESLSDLKDLQYLDLSQNRFSGLIPESLEELAYLTYFNVSFNELSGKIPDEGPFENFTAEMFMGNKGLCGAPRFKVEACKISRRTHSSKTKHLKYILPPIGAGLSGALLLFLILKRRSKKLSPSLSSSASPLGRTDDKLSYHEILYATRNLHEENLVGKGSYGSVYRGDFPDLKAVAIKVFNLDVQGAMKSFDKECQMMHNIRHRNLVKVISSCSGVDFKALVMEYMPKGNLEKWLYSAESSLNISERFRIMVDVASGIAHLHDGLIPPIVHCDLKLNNILLDKDMVAHVADFGIAKLLTQEQRMRQTRTLGMIGYMAPEYGSDGLISTMVDVYSYGILVMEILTRRRPTDEMFSGELTMRRWVSESFPSSVMQIVDQELLRMSDESVRARHERCLTSAMELAVECTTDLAEERPNMKYVAVRINEIKLKLLKSQN
ncbi:hypothetical protein ACS0TY_017365 [Phlomoides rotata]